MLSVISLQCLTLPSHMVLSSSHSPFRGNLLDTSRNTPHLDRRCTVPRSGRGTGVRRCVCLRGKKRCELGRNEGRCGQLSANRTHQTPWGWRNGGSFSFLPSQQKCSACLAVEMLCMLTLPPVETPWTRGVHQPPAEDRKPWGKQGMLLGVLTQHGKCNEFTCSIS